MPSDDFEMVETQSTAAYPQFSAKDFSRWISASDTENQLSVLPQLLVHFQRIYKKQDVATSLSGSLLSAASSFFRSAPPPSQGCLDNADQFLDQLKSIKNVDELDNFLRDLCVQQPQLEAHKVFLSAIVQQYDRERLMKEMISEKRVIDFKRYEQRLLSPDALIAIRDDLYRKICGSMGYVKTESGALSVERRPIFSYQP